MKFLHLQTHKQNLQRIFFKGWQNLRSLRSLRLRLTQAKQAMRPDSLGEHVTVTGKETEKLWKLQERTIKKVQKSVYSITCSKWFKVRRAGSACPVFFYLCRPQKMSRSSKSEIQNPKSKIQNPKSKIQNPKSKNPKSKIQNPKSEIQIQNSPIQNLPPNCYITIQNPTSKIQNSQNSAEKVWILDWGILDFRFRILDSGFWAGLEDVPLGNSVTVPRGQRLESPLARLNSLPVHLFFYAHGARIVGQIWFRQA